MRTRCCFITLLVLVCYAAHADYLVSTRKTSVKTKASGTSAVLVQIETGTELRLLDNGVQDNGYYHVSAPSFEEGWIYRTFVRRYASPEIVASSTDKVEVRVVDVGPGLCTLIKLPNGKYVIYDTGHKQWTSQLPIQQISAFIPKGSVIEMMVLSHNHTDHMGGAAQVVKNYTVKKVVWSGYHEPAVSTQGPLTMNQKFLKALADAPYPIEEVNLNVLNRNITPGEKVKIGDVDFIFLCGFAKPLDTWLNDLKGSGMAGERINSVSVVMKLVYKGNSILFCGDAVGRDRGGPEDQLIATESFLLQNAKQYLASTIMISPHHGADNGNSTAYVDAVKPKRVIFSAGHEYNHPTTSAANRFLKYVELQHIFRTDRGDDERIDGKPDYEWDHTRVSGCIDNLGDDDIDIVLYANGKYNVEYVNKEDPCAAMQIEN
jgi:beta-lactamase superfamily II metal-dependent hydrolase